MDSTQRAIKIIFLIFAALSFVVAFRSTQTPPSKWHLHNDFAHYYITADIYKRGHSPYQFPITSFYSKWGFVNQPRIDTATNPPALVFLTLPLTFLSPLYAFWMWSLIQLLALVFSVLLLLKIAKIPLSRLEAGAVVSALLITYPVTSHFEYGQTQALILLLITVGIWIGCREMGSEGILAPFLWGMAASLKLFTWPLMVVSARFWGIRGILGFITGFLLLNVPPALSFGSEIFIQYKKYSIPYIQGTLTRFNSSNSFTGAVVQTLDIISGEGGVSDVVLVVLSVLSLLGLTAIVIKAFARQKDTNTLLISTSLAISASCLFSPTTWSHYLILCIIPLIVLLRFALCKDICFLHPVQILIAYSLVALTQGRVKGDGLAWELTRTWWGVFALSYLIVLLFRCEFLYAHSNPDKGKH